MFSCLAGGLSVGSKCAVLSTVCLGLTCILVAVIVVLHIKLKAEREEQATHMLQSSSRDQTEKDQLRNSFNSLSQKNLEFETRVNDLTAEKKQLETRIKDLTAERSQLQSNFNSLSQNKLELETRVIDLTTKKGQLETRVKDLTAEKSQLRSNFSSLSQKNLELESRIRSLSEEESKQSQYKSIICVFLLINNILLHITITAERDLIKSYKNTAEELNQTINSLQDNYTDLMTEKHQLQNNFSSLSQKKQELETRVTFLSEGLKKEALTYVFMLLFLFCIFNVHSFIKCMFLCGSGRFFMSTELKSWSDSRQYCRDRGADLVIINTEEKQRFISSLVSERVWIGLSDREQEGIMKWVDNSPLKQGFWLKGEPNNYGGNEDCIQLNFNRGKTGWSPLNSWNDMICSEKIKGICEK
uniref:C-type lectin domain-containing protein n=1 Tax=Cyprinus carpio carpio TaxID=630221 RepID=A0A9J8AN00_CYPCA